MNDNGKGLSEVPAFRLRPPVIDRQGIMPDSADLHAYVCSKYGQPAQMDSSPRLRYSRRYVSADDCYEALVAKLVTEDSRWLDVGCGRDIFPSNYEGAKTLAEKAGYLAGVDPDENVYENDLLSESFQGVVEDYESEQKFDLVTMRMVAEHVVEAERCVAKLAELTKTGGLAVIYTPWKWAPMSIAASLVPFAFHNRLKRLLWDSEEQDTFPTAYRMNTRKDLKRLFAAQGFEDMLYAHLDDCSVLTRYLWLNSLEIRIRNLCNGMRMPYPEFCLLAVFRRL